MKRLAIVLAVLCMLSCLITGVVATLWMLQRPPLSVTDLEAMETDLERAKHEVPRIVECFAWNDESVRLQAAITLSKVGAPAVDPVRAKLKDADPKVRFCAAQTLALMGTAAAPAAADLLACLDDTDADVRRKAVYTLGKIGSGEKVFEGLIKGLGDKNPEVAEAAMAGLKEGGAPPKEALPALAKLAKSPDFGARHEVIQLIGKMGAPAADTLGDLFKTASAEDRPAVVAAAGSLGLHAKPLLPDLAEMMTKNRWWDGEEQLFVIFKACGPDGAKALAGVLRSVHDPKSPHFELADDRARSLLRVLGQIGPGAKDETPLLIDLLKDRPSLRPAVLETLGDIGPAARSAIPQVEALTTDPTVGLQARTTLKRMGVIAGK